MLIEKIKECHKISKKRRLTYLLNELSHILFININFFEDDWRECSFKEKVKYFPVVFFASLIMLVTYMIVTVTNTIIKALGILKEPTKPLINQKNIKELYFQSDLDSYPDTICCEIMNQWLAILYDGWVNVDLKERTKQIVKNRKNLCQKHSAHIIFCESALTTTVRNLSNELPKYA